MEGADLLVIFHSILKVAHIALGRICLAVAQIEDYLGDELARIESSGEGTKAQYRPLHPLSKAPIRAIASRGVFIPPVVGLGSFGRIRKVDMHTLWSGLQAT